ncbi:MAG: class I SAM-dependent methyltransferase [Candidatus Pacebacteria bacterium]|nr:class I SAM-dependent methyltransferase [Candidatus Paceibacterota bacterium]
MKNFISNYKKLCSEYYDLDKPTAPKDALNYYYKESLKAGGLVLEPMCGTGRFLIPLLEKGINIHGVDASSEMLKLCEGKCKNKNLSPTLYFESLTNLKLSNKYNYMFIPSGSFGLLTSEDDAKESLRQLFNYLSDQGAIDVEVERPYLTFEVGAKTESYVTRSDGTKIKLIVIKEYNFLSNVETLDCTYENIINNKIICTEKEVMKIKHYSENDFRELASSIGFKEVKLCKPYNKNEDVNLFRCIK